MSDSEFALMGVPLHLILEAAAAGGGAPAFNSEPQNLQIARTINLVIGLHFNVTSL